MHKDFVKCVHALTGLGLVAGGFYSLYYGSPHVAALLVMVGASNFWIAMGEAE